MQVIRRVMTALMALTALAVYLWFAAVHYAPAVRRRKAARHR